MDEIDTYPYHNRKKLQAFANHQVKMTDAYCCNAYEKEVAYLHFLDPDRLLAGFRQVAGLKEKAPRYTGWEQTEIQGHTLGHYLSALAQAYAYERQPDIKRRIEYICRELKACQREDGYLFAWGEEIFDRVENHKPAWVPWYTMHKIMSGLLLAYKLAESTVAYEVVDQLGDWVYKRCSKWTSKLQKQVLSVEYGGMNDILYDLYEMTEKEQHLVAAQCFDELTLFELLYEGKDVLNGLHANTTIPKINGALNRYLTTGEDYFLTVARHFWDMVVGHHTYITGGNSEWEHFGRPDVLNEERTACNCETCNSYNMLKLTQRLFEITKEKKYVDFYERTWINAILASQNPVTGMSTYFQPMETGFFKVYGSPDEHFWCCTGTGMENFTKLQEGIFFYSKDKIYVNRYISCQLDIKEKDIHLGINTAFPDLHKVKIDFESNKEEDIKVCFFIPEWSEDSFKIEVDDKPASYQVEGGYAVLTLKGKQVVTLELAMKVISESLPDDSSVVAFRYGPIVLSALLGKEKMRMTTTGVNVSVATKDFWMKDYLLLDESVDSWLAQLEDSMIQQEDEVAFTLANIDEKLKFVPYFSQYQQRYGIYWKLCEKGSAEHLKIEEMQQRKWKRLKQSLDCIPVGNDQYELAHCISGKLVEVSSLEGHRCRVVQNSGWLKYELSASEACLLNLVYSGQDESCEFDIYVNQKLLTHEKLTQTEDLFYTRAYEITPDYLLESQKIELIIKVTDSAKACRVFDEIFLSEK